MNIGETIKKLRQEAQLTPSELANRAELSLAFVTKLEKGSYRSLSLDTCKLLADGLGLHLSSFLESLGYLKNNNERPSLQLVTRALRSNGFTDELAQKVVDYAEYIKSKK